MTDRKNFEALLDEYADEVGKRLSMNWNTGAVQIEKRARLRDELLAAYDAGRDEQPTTTCDHCGAPCREEVLMRGGENGWGDDKSRTVKRYTHPAPKADAAAEWVCVPREPTEAMWTAGREPLRFRDAPFPAMMMKQPWWTDRVGKPREDGFLPKGAWAELVWNAMIQASPARGGEKS